MNKKTRRLNYSLSRIKFWNAIRLHLDTFTQISDDQPYLTSEDRINLREIYYMLSLSRNMAEYRESFHKDKFKEAFNSWMKYK